MLIFEQSRVVHLSEGERNYHVFYQMVAGMSSTIKGNYIINYSPKTCVLIHMILLEQLKLAKTSNFNYLQQGGCVTIDGVNDGDEFHNLQVSTSF